MGIYGTFGFDSFWNKCNEVKNSIVIIETKHKNEVFGGFTKVGFTKYETEQYTEDKNAFLYTIRKKNTANQEQYKSKIFDIKKSETKYALWYTDGYLCCFGCGWGSDIWIEQNCNKDGTNNGCYYASYDIKIGSLIDGDHLTVNEMEVFQLNYYAK